MSLYIIYIIRMKNPIKRHFCHLMCKNAAEGIRKFALFGNYRKNLLSFQFVKTVILQLIEIFDFTIYFKIFKKFLIS